MNELIMAKYGEIALKGLNKGTFEDILVKNIRRRLRHCGKFHYMRKQSTIYIEPVGECDLDGYRKAEGNIRYRRITALCGV